MSIYHLHDTLTTRPALHRPLDVGKYDRGWPACPFWLPLLQVILDMDTIPGIQALQWAKEISKLPDGCFTIAFFPYARTKRIASNKLTTKEGCKFRAQLPQDIFQVDSENYFLFADKEGNPKACYRYLIRYMGFPHDGFKLHKINWL